MPKANHNKTAREYAAADKAHREATERFGMAQREYRSAQQAINDAAEKLEAARSRLVAEAVAEALR